MLSVNNVTLSFGGVQALSDVSFTMQANVIHGLIGPNGAGKTSLFNVVSGIYTPTAGSIRFDGKEISRLKLHQINRLGVARTFQNIMVFPDLTLAENVMIGRQDRTRAGVLASILRTRASAPNAAPPANGRSSCCRTSGWQARPTNWPPTCPTANSASWTSRARWPPTPGSCCWTNRPRA